MLTHYMEQRDIQSAFKEEQHARYRGAVVGQASRSQAAGGACRLQAAQSHADLQASLHCPACCIAHCIGADPSQHKVIALVLSSLAESPSLYRMSTKECPLPLSASSLASLPHPVIMHVWDLQSFTVPHGTLYFAHSNQCLALFMVFDAVNENKYGSL